MFEREVIDTVWLHGEIDIELIMEVDSLLHAGYTVEVDERGGRWGKAFVLREDAELFMVAVYDAHMAITRGGESGSLYRAACERFDCAKRAMADARRRARDAEALPAGQ